MARHVDPAAKRRGRTMCIYKGCTRIMSTQRWKMHFVKKHLPQLNVDRAKVGKEPEDYGVRHRDLYERALGDPTLANDPATAVPYFVAVVERLEQRLITCETLLRAHVPDADKVLAPFISETAVSKDTGGASDEGEQEEDDDDDDDSVGEGSGDNSSDEEPPLQDSPPKPTRALPARSGRGAKGSKTTKEKQLDRA